MLNLSYDLHIHSCLSPCGDADMTPANIVAMAALKNLDIIAVTDHNSCKNCPATAFFGKQQGVIVIPGMELCTEEEVHVLCLFADLEEAMAFDEYVSKRLIKIQNNEAIFGKQEIYDELDQLIGTEPYLLINATNISFDELDTLMKEFQGVVIPAHIDKGSNSLLSNLGFIPPDATFRCAEFKALELMNKLVTKNPYLAACNLIINSDAHRLGAINEPIHYLEVKSKDTKDILEALTGNNKLL